MNARLSLDDKRAPDGRRSAILTNGEESHALWFERLDGPLDTAAGADPFVLAAIFACMRTGSDLDVAGPVSRILLRNLADWQEAWRLWNGAYRPVRVTADEVVGHSRRSAGRVVTAFSGGLDSAYTAYRYLDDVHRAGVRPRLGAAMLVHGADIPLTDSATFTSARTRTEKMLSEYGVPLVVVRTNARELLPYWHDGHAAAIGACLAVLAPEYDEGLLPSTDDYAHLVLPWGANPVTDHLMSTGAMAIRTDGAGASRTEKSAVVAEWPGAMRWLRVCWQGPELDRNCGRCEKCIRTILNFRAAGARLPSAFDHDVTDAQIARLRLGRFARIEMEYVLQHCAANGVNGPWVNALNTAVRRSRLRAAALQQLRGFPRVYDRLRTLRSTVESRRRSG